MVSGEQPSDRICHKIEILSFSSLSERGAGLLFEKGGVRVGEGPESPHFIDGAFGSFLSTKQKVS